MSDRARQVLAVDPGKTTGWATWPGPDAGECDWIEFLDRSAAWLEANHGAEIVCERYTITPATLRKSRQYEALYTIGALIWLARRHEASIKFQDVAGVKRLVTNDRLRTLGWYVRGLDHGRDALRHLAVYLAERGEIALV